MPVVHPWDYDLPVAAHFASVYKGPCSGSHWNQVGSSVKQMKRFLISHKLSRAVFTLLSVLIVVIWGVHPSLLAM